MAEKFDCVSGILCRKSEKWLVAVSGPLRAL